MKYTFKSLVLLSLVFFSFNSLLFAEYLSGNKSEASKIELISSSSSETVLKLSVNSYELKQVKTKEGRAFVLKDKDAAPLQIKGAPNLLKFAESILIPDEAKMQVEVIESNYIEIPNIEIAPSKGVLTRDIDPSTIEYKYGKEYKKDQFFPSSIVDLGDPYILRDYRGQVVSFYPFQYNPIKKVLRIYSAITVKVSSTGYMDHRNILKRTKRQLISEEFKSIYDNHFLNNKSIAHAKYSPLDDNPGSMLIISYGDFMDEMQPFGDWKNQKGISTEIVDVATIGNTWDIKGYVENYYKTKGLTYLLLVGDAAQVPSSKTYAGDSDNNYGYILGDDHYLDIFVGRFSAANASQVKTQVARTIHYERDINSTEKWMELALGSASDENNGGDDGESDEMHMDNIKADLEKYGYTVEHINQDGGTEKMIVKSISNGKGVINYVGHGGDFEWVNTSVTSYHVYQLKNNNKLPFIFDVACVNGNFVKKNTCFAESWLRATNGDQPTGAIAIIASTINQSWASPMCAQDEMNDILVGSYANNIKRTFGGITINGIFQMIDEYGWDGNNMADTWTIFGDPSVMLRTKQPTLLMVYHDDKINIEDTDLIIQCNAEGALASLTIDSKIIATEYIKDGTATFRLDSILTNSSVLATVTVTAFNYTSYQSKISIGSGYCTPAADTSTYFISNVDFGAVNNSSNWSDKGFEDYTSLSGNMNVGEDYSILVSTGELHDSTQCTIWVDWNQDKDFLDEDELVYKSVEDANSYTAIITPPLDALSGNTRMRIRLANMKDSILGACSNFFAGEIEDYNLNVVDGLKLPEVEFTAEHVKICTGDSLRFISQTINADTYVWMFNGSSLGISHEENPTIRFEDSGTYSVELTASNAGGFAKSTKIAYITVLPSPEVEILVQEASTANSCDGAVELNVTGGDEPYIYIWNDEVQNVSEVLNLCGGDYELTVLGANGCKVTESVSVSTITGANDYESTADFMITPNPSQGNIFLKINNSTYQGELLIEVFNMQGGLVFKDQLEKSSGNYDTRLNFNWLDEGVYLIKLQIEDKILTEKLMIK